MTAINVVPLPQTAPISDMRNRQDEILTMTENGPVLLMSRSKPAAVLLYARVLGCTCKNAERLSTTG